MDFAFVYLLVAGLTLAIKVGFAIAAAASILVVLVVLHEVAKYGSRYKQ